MKFKLHNKIEISNGLNTYYFYNTMLKSVEIKYIQLKSFNNYLALGTGKGVHLDTNYKLLRYRRTYKLIDDCIQSDITSKNDIFIKKTIIIDDSYFDNFYITEAGLTDNLGINPDIFNHFSLVNEDLPEGVLKIAKQPISISIYIYAEIDATSSGLLTAGSNKFIEYLLGNGLNENIYACRGNCLLSNEKSIERVYPYNSQKFICNVDSKFGGNNINISFTADLGIGETDEVVFLIGDSPFARINLLDYKECKSMFLNTKPNNFNDIILDSDVKEITSVKRSSNNEYINPIYYSKYANDFSDKVNLPFYGRFDYQTPRFLSKDGKMLFFVKDNSIFGFLNEDYKLMKINTGRINISNITNIVSFDKYVFIISKSAPYINSYIVENLSMISCSIDFNSFELNSIIKNLFKVDVTLTKDNYFMFGLIDDETHFGYTLYYQFDRVNRIFYFNTYLKSEFYFTDLISMYKNNYYDAMIMFLKSDTLVYQNRIVYFYANKTTSQIYSTEAWKILYNCKEIYFKGRALIVERTDDNNVSIYYYPDCNLFPLEISNNEINNYISTNLHYLIQKEFNLTYKLYTISDISSPLEFVRGLPSEVNYEKILDFEFLNDTLLIFMDNKNEPVVAYNFYDKYLKIENLPSNSESFSVQYKKYDLVGKNNEGVTATFAANIQI